MKKTGIAIMITLVFSVFIHAQDAYITMNLEAFNELKAFDQINVKLIKSGKNEAVISGDDVDKVNITNTKGLLKVRMELDNFMDGDETTVTLYYTGNLQLIDANEGAKIRSDEELKSKYLAIRTQEGGEIHVNVASQNVDAKAVSAGKIMISGKANNQYITIRSGGEYHAKDLKTDETDVTIFAGGKAIVTAKDYVDANVTAGGTVEIYGSPETVKQDKTFGGTIILKQ